MSIPRQEKVLTYQSASGQNIRYNRKKYINLKSFFFSSFAKLEIIILTRAIYFEG